VLRRVCPGHADALSASPPPVERTTRWGGGLQGDARPPRPAPGGPSCRAAVDEELRRPASATELLEDRLRRLRHRRPVVGGAAAREEHARHRPRLLDELLPADKLRYFMGIGDPLGIVDGRCGEEWTCSTACCRHALARTGTAFTTTDRLKPAQNAAFTDRHAAPRGGVRTGYCCRALYARLSETPGQTRREILGARAAESSTTCAFW